MSDLISRQAAIDALVKAIREDPCYDSNERINGLGVCDVRVVINDLPSAQPDGRYINADELIQRLKGAGHEEAAAMALKMAGHERKKNLPSAQPEQRWIPCSERLPECGHAVLVALDGGSMTDGVRSYDHAGRSVWDCALDNRTWYDEENIVIAWMPLPEPYKEGERMTDLIREVGDKS